MAYINGNKVLFTPIVTVSTTPSKLPQIIDRTVTEITAEDLEGATSIGVYSFYRCEALTSITIPNSATSIGERAFYRCKSLTNITIGNGVTSIGYRAFEDCTGLTNIIIPNNVTQITTEAFYGCGGLTSITIPSGITRIDPLFDGCTNLVEITILRTTPPLMMVADTFPSNVTTIYIPAGTLEAYQNATNWSAFSDKFVELEA